MYSKTHALHTELLEKINTKILFYTCAVILISIFALYAYLVNKTIMNVVARESAEKQIATLNTTIGGLENNYMVLKNTITLDLAHADGFQDATPAFISRNSSTLSYNVR